MHFALSSIRSELTRKVLTVLVVTSIVMTPASPAFAAFGDGTPTIRNPDAFSIDTAAPKVDSQSGAFSQRIVLDIPPGRSGLQPDLALQYNSQNTTDSIVGYGWSLSLPYVQRLNKTGSQNLYVGSSLYYTSSLDGEFANLGTTTAAATTSPSIMDALPLGFHKNTSLVTSDAFSYTVPSGGSNKLLIAMIALGADKSASLAATQNGVSLSCQYIGLGTRAYHHVCYLPNPTSGTFSMSWSGGSVVQYSVMTLKNAAQSSPIDATAIGTLTSSGSSVGQNITTTVGNDLLLDHVIGSLNVTHSFGAGQTQTYMGASTDPFGKDSQSYKLASASPGTESMSRSFSPNDNNDDILIVAIKKATASSALVGNSYKARIDDGSSLSYTFANNTWTAYDKKGNRYLFGSSDGGRQYDTSTGTSTNTYKWFLQEIRDPNNNFVKFTYDRDSNELYPSQILYTGYNATDGIFKITFATSTRSDIRTSYASTFAVTTNYRISEVNARVNNTIVRKYLLGYGTGANGKRSLLKTLQQQGYDENNTLTSLPAMTFTYASSSNQFYSPSAGLQVNGQGFVAADTNGNGINDVVEFYNTGGSNLETMFIDQTTNVNNSFSPPDHWATTGSPPTPVERGVRYIDINADGKADVVRGWENIVVGQQKLYQSAAVNGYASSTGYTWPISVGTSSTTTIPVFAQQNNSFTLTGGVFGDVNGDGLPDFEQWVPSWLNAAAYLGNGTGWDNATTLYFSPAQPFPSTQPTATASQLVDVNGDGLDDWLYSDATKTYVLLNTGTGWQSTPSSQWTIGTSTLYDDPNSTAYYDRGIRYFDINGDGLPDFIRSYSVSSPGCADPSRGEVGTYKLVLLNTANGWATSTLYSLPSYIYTAQNSGCSSWTTTNNEYGNWSGNGQLNQDVLTTATNSKGGSTSVTYSQSTQLSGKNPELPYSLLVVTALGIYDGRGNAATTTYSYAGGKQYNLIGVRDRKFAGFASSTVTAPDSITSTYFGQGMSTSTSLGEQAGGYAQINRPFRKDVFSLAGNLVQKSFYRWDPAYNGNSIFVGLGRQVQQDYAANATHRDRATDQLYASTTNDLIRTTDFGEVAGNSDGTFTDTGTDKRTTNITYAASTSANFTVPTQKTVLNYSSATTSDQKLYYDGLAFGSVTKGNNTKEESWISGSTYASSTKSFNIYGLVASSTDRRGKLTSNIFDAYNLYVASSTNPLSQQTQFTYDYSVGKVKQTTDSNSRLTRNLYDGVGRLRAAGQSDVTTPSSISTTTTYTYTDASTPPSTVRRTDYLTSTTTIDTYSYFDGLGRLIQERKASQYAGILAATDRTYNQAGKLASLSLPYFSSGTSFTSPTALTYLFTNYTYDALQRVTAAANAVGTTTNSYASWTTTTTDANGNSKDYGRDAFGNLISVVEHLGTSLATTTYAYDTRDNLATTTDALGNVRAFTYDGLSRRLTAQDLHYATDTTFGVWSYSYDDAGNMTSQTDPKGQVVNRAYDALGRLLTEDYTGQAGTEVINTYDTCTKGIGYLCTASSTNASSTTVYDALGRAATTTIRVFGIPYSTGNAYDLQGNITTLTYPNSSQVKYTYNVAGMQSRISRKAPGTSTFTDFVSNIDYGPHGQVVNMLFANGASTTKAFAPSALNRLTSIQTVGASGTFLQNFAYLFDPVGNITQIANTASTSAYSITNFSYDQLYRLTVASTTDNYTAVSTTTIAISDTLPLSIHQVTNVTSDSRSYTVPSGGTNKLFMAVIAKGSCNDAAPTATLNGSSLTISLIQIWNGNSRACWYVGYLAAPTSGTFQVNFSSATSAQYELLTLQNAAQTNPIDASAQTTGVAVSSQSTSVTTTAQSDLLLSFAINSAASPNYTGFGTGESSTITSQNAQLGPSTGSYRNAGAVTGTETMTVNMSSTSNTDEVVIAVKSVAASSSSPVISSTPYRQSFTYDWLGNILSLTSGATSTVAASPSAMDTLPLTVRQNATWVTSHSFSYTVPSGGTNKLFVAYGVLGGDRSGSLAATLNGAALTCKWLGVGTRAYHFVCYLPNPSSGTFQLSWAGATNYEYTVLTLKDAAQSSSLEAYNLSTLLSSGSSLTTSTTTSTGNDLLLDVLIGAIDTTHTFGVGQTQTYMGSTADIFGKTSMSYKPAASTPGSESMSRSFSPNDNNDDLALYAFKSAPASGPSSTTTNSYAYAGTGYANPHAVTQTANGVSTTTYNYDNNGNVTQSGIWTYLYDYLNRITTIGGGNSTSTFGYDTIGARVFQAATTSTTTYASKYFSIASTTLSGASWATTTSYIWLGDTLLGTVDQQFKTGAATGTAKTRYVHTDHLGSTNVVTDENAVLVQTQDYYPFGASRISVATSTNQKRKYIGQFADDQTSLDYLNARYYEPARAQFVTQDPSVIAIGSPSYLETLINKKQETLLADPQQLNYYSYSHNNPIAAKDVSGMSALDVANDVAIWTFRRVSEAKDGAEALNAYYDAKSANTLPGVSNTQKAASDAALGLSVASLVPSLSPLFAPVTFWDIFIFVGEKITGRPASDAEQYVEQLKDRIKRESLVPGIDFNNLGRNPPAGSSSAGKSGSPTAVVGTVNVPGASVPRSKEPTGSSGPQSSYCWGVCKN